MNNTSLISENIDTKLSLLETEVEYIFLLLCCLFVIRGFSLCLVCAKLSLFLLIYSSKLLTLSKAT